MDDQSNEQDKRSKCDFFRETRVVHYVDERVLDPRAELGLELAWQEYFGMRNYLVRACKAHGSVGPLRECLLIANGDGPRLEDWENGDDDPDFWIVDDQLNHERYLLIELLNKEKLTDEWFISVRECLLSVPHWGLCITNLQGGYAIQFSNFFLVSGTIFENCNEVGACMDAIRANLNA